MRLLLLICILSLLGQPLVTAQSNTLSASALEQLYESGVYCEIVASGMISEYEKQTPESRIQLGYTLLHTEKWDQLADMLPKLEAAIGTSTAAPYHVHLQLLKAGLLEKQEKFAQAGALYENLQQQSTQWKTRYPAIWQEILVQRGSFLLQTEQYEQAGMVLDKVLVMVKTASATLANAYRLRALVYQLQAQHQAAEDLHKKAIGVWEELNFPEHPGYAESLNDYALLKASQNQLPEAEQLLKKSETINAKCPIPSAVAYNLAARGNIRLQLGDWVEANTYFQESLRTFEERQQHKETALLLNQIGRTYLYADSLTQAGTYFENALEAINKAFPEQKSLYRALIIDGLAQVNDYLDESEIADSLYQLEQEKIVALMGINNIHYSTALNNHAMLKEYLSENEAAVGLYRRSLEIIEPVLGKQHPAYLTTLYNMARLFVFMEQVDSAAYYYQRANSLQLDLLHLYFSSFDEQTRLEYRYQAMGNFDLFFNFACFEEQANLEAEIQAIHLATKNLVLDYAVQTRTEASEDTDAQHLRKRWLANRDLLAKAFQMTPEERQRYHLDVDSLQRQANELEKQLVREMPGHREHLVEWEAKDLMQALDPGEAAIDFFTFGYNDGYDYAVDSLFYFALVSRAGFSKPELVYLTDNKALEAIFEQGTHYTTNAYVGNALYQLVWEPLAPLLQDISHIHLSPDGLLHQLSFEGLMSDLSGKNILGDQHQFSYYSNLRDLIQAEETEFSNRSALLIGAPNFDLDSTALVQQQLKVQSDTTTPNNTSVGPFSDLAGTAREINGLAGLLRKKRYTVQVWAGSGALENRLYDLPDAGSSPGILHLSTHGYFLSEDFQSADTSTLAYRYGTSDNPMLRSGLAFAGANYSWRGGRLPISLEDGILTAEEVANLDLGQTSLVVLSACETGLGKVTDGEGVFGLQRAFKLAGAQQLLISLWKVPDEQTAELMTYFYRYLLRTQDSQLALQKAQQKMKKQYDPFYWAGFVLFN